MSNTLGERQAAPTFNFNVGDPIRRLLGRDYYGSAVKITAVGDEKFLGTIGDIGVEGSFTKNDSWELAPVTRTFLVTTVEKVPAYGDTYRPHKSSAKAIRGLHFAYDGQYVASHLNGGKRDVIVSMVEQ